LSRDDWFFQQVRTSRPSPGFGLGEAERKPQRAVDGQAAAALPSVMKSPRLMSVLVGRSLPRRQLKSIVPQSKNRPPMPLAGSIATGSIRQRL